MMMMMMMKSITLMYPSIWDDTQYQLNYNHNHHSISVWDGTTHADIVYDNNDDATDYEYNDYYDKCGATYDYAYGDSYNMNDPSIRLQFKKCLQVVQDHNDNMKKYIKTVPQAVPQATTQQKHLSKHTTMKHTHKVSPPPYTYNNLIQLLFLTTHDETKTNNCVDDFPLYTVPHYITQKRHSGHDNYLYRRWNNPTAHKYKTKKTRTNQHLFVTKDDTSITPTLETLYTLDKHFLHPINVANDTILSITIWNKSIVQYRMLNQTTTRNQSREHPVLLFNML